LGQCSAADGRATERAGRGCGLDHSRLQPAVQLWAVGHAGGSRPHGLQHLPLAGRSRRVRFWPQTVTKRCASQYRCEANSTRSNCHISAYGAACLGCGVFRSPSVGPPKDTTRGPFAFGKKSAYAQIFDWLNGDRGGPAHTTIRPNSPRAKSRSETLSSSASSEFWPLLRASLRVKTAGLARLAIPSAPRNRHHGLIRGSGLSAKRFFA